MPDYRILIGLSAHERHKRDSRIAAGEVVEETTRPPIIKAAGFGDAIESAGEISLKEGERIRGVELIDLRINSYQAKVWDPKKGRMRTFGVMAENIEQALHLAIPNLAKDEVLKKLWLPY